MSSTSDKQLARPGHGGSAPAPVDSVAAPVQRGHTPATSVSERAEAHPLIQDLLLNPSRWRIWPAVAVLRWLQRRLTESKPRLVFRSRPSLSFPSSEVDDIQYTPTKIELVLNAPGLATAGSPLPASDIARIIADHRAGGALAAWLDGPGDRLMQLLEQVQMRSNAAYAMLTGGTIEAFSLAADLVGRSAPLSVGADGALLAVGDREPQGAVGLAALFVGPVSSAGMGALFRAITGLPVRIEEFAGAELPTARPARLGLPMGMVLGLRVRLPSAGVEVHLEGGDHPDAPAWARDPASRRSLHTLALAYVGAPSPVARIYLWLDADNVTPCALDGGCALGGMAVLGAPSDSVRLPLCV